jgi:hypothetical protein
MWREIPTGKRNVRQIAANGVDPPVQRYRAPRQRKTTPFRVSL